MLVSHSLEQFDICTCLSAESCGVSWTTCILYLFTTKVLSGWSPLRMRWEMFTLEPLAERFFMGDIIQLQILIYGRELGCDEQITAPTTYSNFCFQAGAFRPWFVLSSKWKHFLVREWERKRGLFSYIKIFWKRAVGWREVTTVQFCFFLVLNQFPTACSVHSSFLLGPALFLNCYGLHQKVNQALPL